MTTASGRSEAARNGQSFAFQPAPIKRIRPGAKLANPLITLIFLLGVMGSSCGGDPKPGSARASVAPIVPVSVATAERRDVPYYLTGLGSVNAYYTVSVKSRVDGELMQVNFKEGQNRYRKVTCWR